MKKTIVTALLILALAGLASCGDDKPENKLPNNGDTTPTQSIVTPKDSDTMPDTPKVTDGTDKPDTPDTSTGTPDSSKVDIPDTSDTVAPDTSGSDIPMPPKTDTPDETNVTESDVTAGVTDSDVPADDSPNAQMINTLRQEGEVQFENDTLLFTLYDGKYYAANTADNLYVQVELAADKWVVIDSTSPTTLMLIDNELNYYRFTKSTNTKKPLTAAGKFTESSYFAGFRILTANNTSYSIIADNDNNILLTSPDKLGICSDMMVSRDSSDNIKSAYNFNLEKICDEDFYRCQHLEDGCLLVAPDGTETFRIYSAGGELKFESKKYDLLLDVIEDLILVIDEKQAKLVDMEANEVAVLCDWSAKTFFRSSLSKCTDGVYSVTFEDRSDSENTVTFECSYNAATGEVTRD